MLSMMIALHPKSVYVLYLSIIPSKYSSFPRGCHYWRNHLKRWTPPILLLCVVLLINFLISHHWKKTALWIGKTALIKWLHYPNSLSVSFKFLALCRMEMINKCFSKRTVEEIISALVSCVTVFFIDGGVVFGCYVVHLFTPAKLVFIFVRNKKLQIRLMNGLQLQSSPWKRPLRPVWKSPWDRYPSEIYPSLKLYYHSLLS